jgi:D-methionine transport system permease protein
MTPDNLALAWKLIPLALLQTLYMVLVSGFFAILVGLPLGITLFLTPRKRVLYKALSLITNIGRSFPFAILMIALIPFTKWIVGTSLGTTAATVPLAISAAPFIARLIESSLRAIDPKLLEASSLMGASSFQLITKILIPESLPANIQATTLTLINLIGYSAMAGLIGGGGLGQVAIQYGYNRFNSTIMYITVILLIILVEIVQRVGNHFSFHLSKKRGKAPHA